jgi:hypothetical protein
MARDEGKIGGDGKTSPFGNGNGAPQRPMNAASKSGATGDGLPKETGGTGVCPDSVVPGGPLPLMDPGANSKRDGAGGGTQGTNGGKPFKL